MDTDQTYSVFIAEDEMPARELILDYILAWPELRISGIAKNGEDAFKKLSGRTYDLVLMDIHLPRMTGIEVLERLKVMPYLIFTTAYERYAIRAFEVGAVDYLLKPITAERFNRSIEKFLHMRRAACSRPAAGPEAGFAVKDGGKHYILPYQDIVSVSSHGKSSVIHTVAEDHKAPIILKKFEEKAPSQTFVRIHKQHIVNLRYIAALEYYIGGQYIAFLKDEDESALPVGKKYAPLLKARFNMD